MELFVSKKQQNLRSRNIVSLAFRKLCWFASSSAGNRKLRAARKIGNFLSTKFSIALLPVFDGFRPRSGRDLLATGGCIQRERLFSSKNIAPWEYIHLRKTFAEANLCFHVISSQVQTYRCRR